METYGIIAASPIIPRDKQALTHRIVIRDLGDKFVVHMQVWGNDGRAFFHHGNYFKRSNAAPSVAMSDREALGKARAAFERRSRRTLGLEEVGVLAE